MGAAKDSVTGWIVGPLLAAAAPAPHADLRADFGTYLRVTLPLPATVLLTDGLPV